MLRVHPLRDGRALCKRMDPQDSASLAGMLSSVAAVVCRTELQTVVVARVRRMQCCCAGIFR